MKNELIGKVLAVVEDEHGTIISMMIKDKSTVCFLLGHEWDKGRSGTRWYCSRCKKSRKRR